MFLGRTVQFAISLALIERLGKTAQVEAA